MSTIFKDARLGRIRHYTELVEAESTVATVEFELNSQRFPALNGDPCYLRRCTSS